MLWATGVLCLLAGLPLDFFDEESTIGDRETTWILLRRIVGIVVSEPSVLQVGSLGDFLEGLLPAVMLVFSYLLLVPAFILMLLAARSRIVVWLARGMWLLVWMAGPVCLFFVLDGENPGTGFACWFFGVLSIAAAHWMMAPRKIRALAPPFGHAPGA